VQLISTAGLLGLAAALAPIGGASTVHPAVIVNETPSGAVAEPAKEGCGIATARAAASPQATANTPRRPNAGIGPILPSFVRRWQRRFPPFRRAIAG
jgi:hypothetical protein